MKWRKEKRERPRLLEVEMLEGREMLDGTVKVAVVAGNVNITGDNLPNCIVVAVGGGTLSVGNFDGPASACPGPTAVIGSPVSVVGRHVNIKLKGGDDFLTNFVGAAFPKNLNIKLGLGNDSVVVGAITVGGNAKIESSDGNDHVSLGVPGFPVAIAGRLDLDMGRGADITVVFGTTVGAGFTELDADAQNDLVCVGASMFTGVTKFNGGLGTADVFADLGSNVFVTPGQPNIVNFEIMSTSCSP